MVWQVGDIFIWNPAPRQIEEGIDDTGVSKLLVIFIARLVS